MLLKLLVVQLISKNITPIIRTGELLLILSVFLLPFFSLQCPHNKCTSGKSKQTIKTIT